jgi:dephospho-CoA kinase
MIRWAVTGPAGGGKSTLCRLLAERGAGVIDGDLLGHEILVRADIASAVCREFGTGIMVDGQVDRSALGRIVFDDLSDLDRLNRITLAPIAELAAARLDALASKGRYRLAVLEAAVYFLFPPVPGMDLVVSVTADPETRIARMMENRSLSRTQAQARLDSQRPLEEGWTRADLVLDNNGPLADLEKTADELWGRLEV